MMFKKISKFFDQLVDARVGELQSGVLHQPLKAKKIETKEEKAVTARVKVC